MPVCDDMFHGNLNNWRVFCSFELTNDMQTACDVYAQWLEDSTMVNTKQLVRRKIIAYFVPFK